MPFARLRYIASIKAIKDKNDMDVCITCPLTRHTYLHFPTNDKIRQEAISIDPCRHMGSLKGVYSWSK